MGDTYTVERRLTVRAEPSAVFERLVDFHRWPAWSPWEDIDPDMERSYSGTDAGVGAVYEWKGNRRAGQGRMEITRTEADSVVAIALRFLKPFKSESTTVFALRPDATGTEVTWTMTGPKTFMTRLMGIFRSMDEMVGPDFDKGLARLKADVEGG